MDDERYWAGIKAEFPAAGGSIYLNTAGGGCMSRVAAAAGRRFYDEAEAEGDMPWDRWLARAAEARGTVASLIGADQASIALLPNASTGLDLLHRLFDDGRDVVVIDREFPSVTLPAINQGRGLRVVRLNNALGVDWDQVDPALVAGASTLFVSHTGFRTGYRFDLGEVSRFAARHGLRLVVDATQSVGTTPIDLAVVPIDALVFSSYKWCGAGYGIAALYLRDAHRWPTGLPAAGWRSAEDPYALLYDQFTPRPDAHALELGHPPFAAAFALNAALRVLLDVGVERIAARILDLNRHLHAGLDRLEVPICSTRDPAHQSGITIARVPDAAEVVNVLRERGIVIGRRAQDEVRLSVHLYTLKVDIDAFLEALSVILTKTARPGAGSNA